MVDSLKDVIARIKQQQANGDFQSFKPVEKKKKEEKKIIEPSPQEMEEIKEEVVKPVRQVQVPVQNPEVEARQEESKVVQDEFSLLHNSAIFRNELLVRLKSIDDSLQVIAFSLSQQSQE